VVVEPDGKLIEGSVPVEEAKPATRDHVSLLDVLRNAT
jgi:hypothetical protein